MVALLEPGGAGRRRDQRVDLAGASAHPEVEVVVGLHPGLRHHRDVPEVPIVVVLVADVEAGRVGAVDPYVVVDRPVRAFAKLHAHADAEVVVDLVVRRAVVEIEPPARLLPEAVEPQDHRLHRVHEDVTGIVAPLPRVLAVTLHQTPVLVPTPGIERSVVTGLPARVVDVVVLDEVPAPGSVADADACPRHVGDLVVTDRDPLGAADVDSGYLLAEHAAPADHIVGHRTLVREVPLRPDRRGERSNEAHRAVAELGEQGIADHGAPVAVVQEDSVSSHCVEEAVPDLAVPGALEQHRPAAVDRPVA